MFYSHLYLYCLHSFLVSLVPDANQMSAMFAAGRAIPKIEPTDSTGPRSSWMVQPPPPRLSQVQQVQAQVQAQQQQQAASQQQPQSQSQPAQHSLCKLKGFSFYLPF